MGSQSEHRDVRLRMRVLGSQQNLFDKNAVLLIIYRNMSVPPGCFGTLTTVKTVEGISVIFRAGPVAALDGSAGTAHPIRHLQKAAF